MGNFFWALSGKETSEAFCWSNSPNNEKEHRVLQSFFSKVYEDWCFLICLIGFKDIERVHKTKSHVISLGKANMCDEAFKEHEEGNLFTSSRQAARARGFSTHVTQHWRRRIVRTWTGCCFSALFTWWSNRIATMNWDYFYRGIFRIRMLRCTEIA